MPINTFLNKTKRYSRHTYGDDGLRGKRNILSLSFVASDLQRAALAAPAALMAAGPLATSGVTTQTPVPNPDVPRNITLTLGGTTASIGAGNAVVTGTNAEGAVITENIVVTAATGGLLTGNKAFKTVTSVVYPATTGAGATASIGYGSKLGIGMRNIASMPIKVLVRSAAGVETLEDPSASVFSATVMENNTVTTATAQDGARSFRVYVLNYKWAVDPINSNPDYGL